MNALLLTALNGSTQAGLGTLLNKKVAASDASFADLLDQQTESLNPELVEMLASLNLDPQAQKALLAQLEQLGISPDRLQTLGLNLQSLSVPVTAQKPLATTQTHELNGNAQNPTLDASTKEQSTNHFVHTTLFVAQESNALRQVALNQAPAQQTGVLSLAANAKDAFNPLATESKDKANRFTTATLASRMAFNTDHVKTPNQAATWEVKIPAIQTPSAQTNGKEDLTWFQSALGNVANSSSASSPSDLPTFSLQAATQTSAQSSFLNTPFSATYSTQITTPLHQATQWGTDFGRVMVQLSQQASQSPGLKTAEIRLDPPELGPLRIVLSINESVANAMIFAAHAQTRHTVEQALPQLQQQLAQAGLSLGEANVSDQGFSAQSEQHPNQKPTGQHTFSLSGADQSNENTALLPSNAQTKPIDPNAIIDTFA